MQSFGKPWRIVTEPILVQASHKSVRIVCHIVPATYELRTCVLEYALSVGFHILWLIVPIGIGIGWNSCCLSLKQKRVVGETALHYASVGEFQEPEHYPVPSAHQWHESVVMKLYNVVAAHFRKIGEYVPQHSQTAQLAPTHITAQLDVAW